MPSEPENEIGRELMVCELEPDTVVVVGKDGRPEAATMWVKEITPDFVAFYMGKIRTVFWAQRTGLGREELTDDAGSRLHVHQYLGEI